MAKQIIINGRTSKFNTTNWVDSDTGVAPVKKRDKFLVECAGYTDDDYWHNLIINMSNGTYPKNLTYHNGTLINNANRLALNIDPEIACDEIISFIRTYLNLHSPNDEVDVNEDETEELPKDTSGEMWSTMLKKHKEQAIVRFMNNEQRRRGLSPIECERLHCILNFGFTLKYFHKDNVSVSNFTIVKIDGLIFDPESRTYSIDMSQRKKENRAASRSNVKPKKNYNDTWQNICNKVTEDSLELGDLDHEDSIIDEEYSRSTN